MTSKSNEICSISFLRGLASVMVALYHLKGVASPDSIFANLFRFGAFGVDLFFMISGFVIVIATKKNSGVFNFAVKRLFRIYPPLIFAVLFHIYFNNKEITLLEFIKSVIPLQNDYSSNSPEFNYSFLVVAWTITFELAFYSVFMISLSLSHKYRALICSVLMISTVILTQWYFNGYFSILYASSSPVIPEGSSGLYALRVFGCSIMLEFIVGMGLAYLYMNLNIKNSEFIRKCFILFSVISLMYLVPCYLGGYYRGHGLAGYGVWSILILLMCLGAEKLKLIKWRPEMLFIGAISYSLYLYHIPVHEFIARVNPDGFRQISNSEIRSVVSMMFELTASIIVSYASYKLIEIPSQSVARYICNIFNAPKCEA